MTDNPTTPHAVQIAALSIGGSSPKLFALDNEAALWWCEHEKWRRLPAPREGMARPVQIAPLYVGTLAVLYVLFEDGGVWELRPSANVAQEQWRQLPPLPNFAAALAALPMDTRAPVEEPYVDPMLRGRGQKVFFGRRDESPAPAFIE